MQKDNLSLIFWMIKSTDPGVWLTNIYIPMDENAEEMYIKEFLDMNSKDHSQVFVVFLFNTINQVDNMSWYR